VSAENYGQPERKGGIVQPILIGAVAALIGGNVYQFVQNDKRTNEIAELRKNLKEDIEALKIASSQSARANQRTVDSLQSQLEAAQRQAQVAVGQAKADAIANAERIQQKLQAEQERQKRAVAEEFSRVKEEVKSTDAKVGEVKTEVGTVRTEVASTKSELDKTISSLKSVQGDMGVQSGLIATNSRELEALKALGQRNYYEFNLGKTKQPQRIGDILMMLKRTDQKRNKYTVEVTADDKTVEKKDKGVAEPVQFLVAKARQPYELVVMEVKKDIIVGYLSTPKVMEPRR
jgi:chromosome segregation ATPase